MNKIFCKITHFMNIICLIFTHFMKKIYFWIDFFGNNSPCIGFPLKVSVPQM